jgi:hypothetical protein
LPLSHKNNKINKETNIMVQLLTDWNVEKVYEKLKEDNVNLSTKFSYSHTTKTENKAKQLSLGRIWFNCLLPDDFELINEKVDKPRLDNIFKQMYKKYSSEELAKYFNTIQKEAYKIATFEPRSMSIEMFTPSEEWLEKKRVFLEDANSGKLPVGEKYNKVKNGLIDDLEKELQSEGVKFIDALNAKSTSKMSKETWKALQVSKGVTADIEDNINMIHEGISDGYSIENYYKAASEARNGFYIKSTAVRDPGYLTRKVIMANANIKIDRKDCKTKQLLEVYATPNKAKTLIGRYMINSKNELVLIENVDQIINQKIKIRSPFYCKSKIGICEICYGNLINKLENDNIGILAGGAINMENVNAMMKMRHKAEKVEIVEVNFIESVKKSTVNAIDLNRILDIKEKEIIAKEDISIVIDLKEYNDKNLVEYENKYVMPGLLTIQHGTENIAFYSLPFNFDVNLYKTDNLQKRGKIIQINYVKGEKVLDKDKYMKKINPAVITKILDGVTKYTKDPRILLEMLIDEMPSTDSCHLELTISNLFRSEANLKIPARLNNYKDPVIVGVKQIPFVDSWLNGLAFENINKAIQGGLINEEDAVMNPIEKVLVRETYKKE